MEIRFGNLLSATTAAPSPCPPDEGYGAGNRKILCLFSKSDLIIGKASTVLSSISLILRYSRFNSAMRPRTVRLPSS